MRFRRVLVALEFPGQADQPALDKALQLAQRQRSRVEICHIAYDPGVVVRAGRAARRDVESVVALRKGQLDRLVERRSRAARGLRVTTRVDWGRPAYEGIVAAAAAFDADLVVGQSVRRGLLRHLLSYVDWQLIRHCRRPLLLVKSTRPWRRPVIVAAVDPLHAHDKPAVLDRAILDAGGSLARALNGRLYAYHAFSPAVRFVPGTALEPLPVLAPPAQQRRHERAVRQRVLRVTRAARLPASRVRLEAVEPVRGLPAYVADRHAAIAVLGAVSRRWLQRWLVGSTAEKVLDALHCDMLAVPPMTVRTRGRTGRATGPRRAASAPDQLLQRCRDGRAQAPHRPRAWRDPRDFPPGRRVRRLAGMELWRRSAHRIVPKLLVVLSTMSTNCPVAAATAARYTEADEAVYRERFARLEAAFRLGIGLESYEPLERVPGAMRHRPWRIEAPAADSELARAIAAARDYAGRNRSSAFMVWQRGRLLEASYFGKMRADATFPSRSLAKPMTAIAVGRALALGHIRSLDQPAADFLVEWRDDPRRSKILIRHLLDMRSGLLPQAVATTVEDILNRAYLHPRHEEVILHDYPIVDDPGTRYEYSNATSELVALVIERATGRRYAEFVGREILAPIGAAGGEVWINRPGGLAHSGCCMLLPPESWLRLGVLLLRDGVWQGRRLLPRGYVAAMAQGTAQNPWYGLGVYVAGDYIARRPFANPERVPPDSGVLHGEPYLARDLFLFDGNANQVVYIIPSAELVVLRVGEPPPRSAAGEWDNTKLPNLLLRALATEDAQFRRRSPGPQRR